MREKMNICVVGHVDHGKSTLIGRMLADTDSLPEGKLEQIKELCRKNSKTFEYAFLLDALDKERDQGITIDIARCFFKTKKRDYIILDTPGHIEFLKNMVTGASRAEGAILMIDADEGIQENSKRHGLLTNLLGINQLVVCVNKMDLVNYDQKVFNKIQEDYTNYLATLGITAEKFIPVSSLKGENVTKKSKKMKWYKGMTILEQLDTFRKSEDLSEKPLRMPIQGVYKFTGKEDNKRYFSGKIESGKIKEGDEVIFYPSKKSSKVKSIEIYNKPGTKEAIVGESIGVTLEKQLFIDRGEILCCKDEISPNVYKQFKVSIFWMGKSPLVKNKKYILKLGTFKQKCKLKSINFVLDAESVSKNKKTQIEKHDVAECVFELDKEIAFDIDSTLDVTSRFVIVDNYEICGGGIIKDYTQSDNLTQFIPNVTRKEWNDLNGHKSKVIWLTGLSGSGKSTIANLLNSYFYTKGIKSYVLDGDNVRSGLCKDLGFSGEDRTENIRRIAEVSKLFADSGTVIVASFITPLEHDRDNIRAVLGDDYVECYVKASLDTCIERDPKDLYKKAKNGEIKNFTGLDSPYEEPKNPDMVLDTETKTSEECVVDILNYLKKEGVIE